VRAKNIVAYSILPLSIILLKEAGIQKLWRELYWCEYWMVLKHAVRGDDLATRRIFTVEMVHFGAFLVAKELTYNV